MPGQVPDANTQLNSQPHFPQHLFASPSSSVDLRQVKPHACMQNIENRGNYIHCFEGNHGIHIPQGKMLSKDANGEWRLEDMIIRDENGNPLYHPNDVDNTTPLTLGEFVKL